MTTPSSVSCSSSSSQSNYKKSKKQRVSTEETSKSSKEESTTQLFNSSLETLKRLYPSYKSKYLEKILFEFNGDLVSASKQLSLKNNREHEKSNSPKNDINENVSNMFDSSFKCYQSATLGYNNNNNNSFVQNSKPFSSMYFGHGNIYDQKYQNPYLNDQTALALQQFNAAVASIPFSYRPNNASDVYNPFQFPYFSTLQQSSTNPALKNQNDLFSYTNDLQIKMNTTTATNATTSSCSSASSSPSLSSNGLLCISSSNTSSKNHLSIDTSNCNFNKNNKLSSK
jgi:hypothetical protein